MNAQIEIMLIAVIVAIASALVGTFLVLKGQSMMTDAITHTILLGIVLAFFITQDLSSPLLIVGATIMGVVTVFLTETLERTKLVAGDAATGVIFPLLFSIAIILISKYSGDVHLDTDAVLLGELAFAPFDRMVINGVDIGAKSVYVMLIILVINLVFIKVFFKELKLATFDFQLALSLGFAPLALHYAIMGLTSLTAVASFNAVGSVLVIAFMIGPPSTAYLLTDDLKEMLIVSTVIGALSAVIGTQASMVLDVSIAGTIAVTIGIIFALVFIFRPRNGVVALKRKRKQQEHEFRVNSLLVHLYNHDNKDDDLMKTNVNSIHKHLNWDYDFTQSILSELKESEYLQVIDDQIILTTAGRHQSLSILNNLFH